MEMNAEATISPRENNGLGRGLQNGRLGALQRNLDKVVTS